MACASPLRVFALRSSPACQDVQQWPALKLTIASPRPQACAEFYLRIAPATCAFKLRHSRTYTHAAPSTLTLLTPWHLRTAFIISTFTLPRCKLLSRLNHSHQCASTLPFSQSPSHFASLQLTFALVSPSHLLTASRYNLFPQGFEDRMSSF